MLGIWLSLTHSPEMFAKEFSSLQMFGKEVIEDVTKSRIWSAKSAHL